MVCASTEVFTCLERTTLNFALSKSIRIYVNWIQWPHNHADDSITNCRKINVWNKCIYINCMKNTGSVFWKAVNPRTTLKMVMNNQQNHVKMYTIIYNVICNDQSKFTCKCLP